ncbi:peritrophin-44 isoform X2 [Drosophila biarmipes]|uniref:peritrophin-44 isoform X2 n=1 Tax=Drosophila biarmipes TaxID=125945 RepID=UPI0007E6D29B|nr:peritrophin-44 isoform X2 [Drosophila biarmipes]
MKAFHARICVLAACLLMASQASGYSMEQMCAQWSGEGYIGNPSSCRAWGYCRGQQLIAWNTCPDDLIFNAQTGRCSDPATTICSTSATQTCAAATSPMYVANPLNCTEYCYCDGLGGLSYGDCGEGGVYQASTKSCVWGPACPQDTICRFMPSNIFVGDPENCGSYYNCVNGYGTSTKCADNLYYNAANGLCQSTNPCNSDNNNGNSGQFTVGETNEIICNSTNFKEAPFIYKTSTTTAESYKYVSDFTTCYGYYYCPDVNEVGVWNQCPTGTQFDPKKGKCVSPAAYACPYNRCGNVESTFMAQLNTECKSYTICSSGLTGSCPTTSPYYDEVHNLCTSGKLDYAICKSA